MKLEEDTRFLLGLLSISVIKYVSLWSVSRTRPEKAKLVGQVSALYIYPVKSFAGIRLERALTTESGLRMIDIPVNDREFIVCTPDGRFITQRQIPKMALIQPSFHGNTMRLDAPGMTQIEIPLGAKAGKTGRVITTKVWGDRTAGLDCGDTVADWIGSFIGESCRLLYAAADLPRRSPLEINKSQFHRQALEHDHVAFADMAAYLLTNESSLTDLNGRLDRKVDMRRFRPNIVMRGPDAFHEDKYQQFYINDRVKLRYIKPCDRCILTTVDPDKGTKDDDGQPLLKLREYRSFYYSTMPVFGVNLFQDYGGVIEEGDPIYMTEKETNILT